MVNVNALDRDADLSRGTQDRVSHSSDSFIVQPGIAEDNGRIVATQVHEHFFDRSRCEFHDPASGLRAACECDCTNAFVACQLFAEDSAGTGNAAENSGWEMPVDDVDTFHECQRAIACRLDYSRVSGRNRGDESLAAQKYR